MSIVFDKGRNCIGLGLIIVLCVIVFLRIFVTPNPKGMSPKNIVKLYYKARNSGNTELLERIIYFPPETTDEQRRAKIQSIVVGAGEKVIMRMVGSRRKIKYEKFLDETTAEVGVITTGKVLPILLSGRLSYLGKQHPVDQVILKKDDGIWKYYYSMAELPKGVLIENLKNNPEDTDLYFHLARAYLDENPAKSHRYYLKYYELAPDGFWTDEDFGDLIKQYRKEYEDTEIYEQEMLVAINIMPANHILSKTIEYQRLCQLFMEKKDYKKASSYLMLAEETLKKDNSEYNYWKRNLDKVKIELQLRLEGKYVDLLDE